MKKSDDEIMEDFDSDKNNEKMIKDYENLSVYYGKESQYFLEIEENFCLRSIFYQTNNLFDNFPFLKFRRKLFFILKFILLV